MTLPINKLFTFSLFVTLQMIASTHSIAEPDKTKIPEELKVIRDAVGVWDAKIEVWPQGLDSPSITFKGVETNRAYGKHWLASDFDSEYKGNTIKVHSIVGYDLETKQLVGTVIDHGPYAAKMIGEYDKKSKTINWTTKAKDAEGKPIVQKTSVTQKSPTERFLVLSVPDKDGDGIIKFMEITFVKRK